MSRVRGVEHFSDFFKSFEDNYVIIGGAAVDIILKENDLDFRATKDVDIVILTNFSKELNDRISAYVDAGSYEARETVSGKQYFRFSNPQDKEFPEIIELFAANQSELKLRSGQYIIPIKNEEAAKLSAILLDNEYFQLIKQNCHKSTSGVSIINPTGAICLKAREFRELTERRNSGDEQVDEKDIRKHRNDILRIAQVLDTKKSFLLGRQSSLDLQMVIEEIRALDEKTVRQVLTKSGITKDSLVNALISSFSFN